MHIVNGIYQTRFRSQNYKIMSTILIGGGTGMIGQRLSHLLNAKGHKVLHLSRTQNLSATYPAYEWDIKKGTINEEVVRKADYIINLAGAGVADKRWTAARKKVIINSRVATTLLLKKAIEKYKPNLQAYLSASAIGYYGDRSNEELTEYSKAGQRGFLAESVLEWEAAINQVAATSVRTVGIRIGVVLSTKGGALPKLLLPTKLGVGGYFDDGSQWYAWVHIDDVCRLFIYAIEQTSMHGFYNGTSPYPETNKVFTQKVGEAINKNLLLIPAPAFAMRLGMGEMADTVLGSSKVLPARTLETGFKFEYPYLAEAVKDVIERQI